MKRIGTSLRYISIILMLLMIACAASAQTNIAPTGKGYTWHTMTTATATTNQTAAAGINDGNLTVGVNADVAGEPSVNKYEAGGVIFSSAQSSITQVDFINGAIDSYGNGFFEANMALQTYNGTAWSNVSGWSLSPTYPYSTAAGGVTYTFTGPALNGVLGVRIVGEVRVKALDNSWSWIVNEVQVWANQTVTGDFTLTATPSSQSITAGNGANFTVTVAPLNGFTGTVGFSASGLPTGATATFSPTSVTKSGSTTMSVNTQTSTAAGTYTLTITGTSGSLTHTAAVTVQVSASTGGNVLNWMGYAWNMTNGGSAGVLQASQNNISVDANGYLHLRITKSGSTFTGSEMFTQDNLGFGTYQWQIQGSNIYNMDPPVVLGLFPYGPENGIGVDGENELDIEFSNWNGAFGSQQVNADFTDYPSTGNKLKGGASEWEDDFEASSAPTYTTARIQWSSTSVTWTLMSGLQPIGTIANVIKQDTFTGNSVTIPQQAIPVGTNLWSYQVKPTNTWEIIIQSFQYVAQ